MKELRASVERMAAEKGWDGEAIWAVMGLETARTYQSDAGLERWSPSFTATGLLQFTEGTLRMLGVRPTRECPREELPKKYAGEWRTWEIAGWPEDYQVSLARSYFQKIFSRREPKRPVDYYLACWGAAPGLPLSTVLASKGQRTYELNRGLDIDDSGKIEVKDLARLVRSEIRRLRSEASSPSASNGAAGLTLGGAIVTIGFKVLERRMLLL